MKRVILCVDDFGLKPEVNGAVVELVDRGVVSATGCMSQGPAWREGVQALKGARRARLDVGLHFNLTERFANNSSGRMPMPLSRLIACSLIRSLNAADIERAIAQQLDAFEDAWGAPPDFVDGHQHVHQLPQVREALLKELQRRYGQGPDGGSAFKPWLRLTRARRGEQGVAFKHRVIEGLGARGFEAQARAAGFTLNGALLGVYGFDLGPEAYAAQLKVWLSQAREGDVLMLHPACPTTAAESNRVDPDAIAHARVIEYTVLRDQGATILTQEGVCASRMDGASSMLCS